MHYDTNMVPSGWEEHAIEGGKAVLSVPYLGEADVEGTVTTIVIASR